MTVAELENRLWTYRGKCLRVVDGDTLEVEIDLGFRIYREERLRLYGLDTPEVYGVPKTSESYQAGKKASDFVKSMIENKQIHIETIKDGKDKYGRFLAKVWFTNESGDCLLLNDVLLEKGLAVKAEY